MGVARSTQLWAADPRRRHSAQRVAGGPPLIQRHPFSKSFSWHTGDMLPRLLCAAFLALIIFACGGGAPEPTPSPAVSPVPDNVTIHLELADRLYVEGDAAGAVLIYSAAALRGSPEQRQQGLWALARIQYEAGDTSRASQNPP